MKARFAEPAAKMRPTGGGPRRFPAPSRIGEPPGRFRAVGRRHAGEGGQVARWAIGIASVIQGSGAHGPIALAERVAVRGVGLQPGHLRLGRRPGGAVASAFSSEWGSRWIRGGPHPPCYQAAAKLDAVAVTELALVAERPSVGILSNVPAERGTIVRLPATRRIVGVHDHVKAGQERRGFLPWSRCLLPELSLENLPPAHLSGWKSGLDFL